MHCFAKLAKLDAAEARIETLEGTAQSSAALTAQQTRPASLTSRAARSFRLGAMRIVTELADALRRVSASPARDVRELWRRMLFNFLITNVDDHLWNVGVANGDSRRLSM